MSPVRFEPCGKAILQTIEGRPGAPCARKIFLETPAGDQIMSLDHSGKSHDEAFAARKQHKPRSLEQPGGEMAVEGTQADEAHSSGELSERGKQVWRTGSGIDGGGKCR